MISFLQESWFPKKRNIDFHTPDRWWISPRIIQLADIFEVSPHALAVPDIDSYVGLMHTLFTLEDLYGLHIDEIDGELCLRLDKSKGTTYLSMFDMFHAWQEQAEKLKSGEITQEEYDQWRYNYPKSAK